MKRQLERRKRQREALDPVAEKLLALLQHNTSNASLTAFFETYWTDASIIPAAAGEAVPATATAAVEPAESEPLTTATTIASAAAVHHTTPNNNNNNSKGTRRVIEGESLARLCALVECQPNDLVRIARTVPHSLSTDLRIEVSEILFALVKAGGPLEVRDRRMQSSMGPVSEDAPMIQYYKDRLPRLHQDPVEWTQFLDSLGTPLPMSLRVHCSELSLFRIAQWCLGQPPLQGVVVSAPPFGGDANTKRPQSLQMFSCSHEDYHSHKAAETMARSLHAASAVSFQEIVSAIPPLILGIEPHHHVLDMCAAPGSKSLQALDSALRCNWLNASDSIVWLNEKDRTKATQTLPARLKRYHAPNAMITRCDATQLPRLYNPADTAQPKLFDRIICDVPCSGDGTVRKERSTLSTWSPSYVSSLIPTQRSLLKRAIDMLAIGGIVVYSTCSMNPLEDEAIVANALTTFRDCCELLNVNEILQSHGIHLKSEGGVDLLPSEVPETLVREGPATVDPAKVLRVFPHRNDTGGFFIAAIRKTAFPSLTQPEVLPSRLNQWMNHKRWEPVQVAEDPHWANIVSFYGIPHRPSSEQSGLEGDYFLDRFQLFFNVNPNGGPQRRICVTTNGLGSLLRTTKPFKGPGVEIVSVGARLFEHYDGNYVSDAPCRWRCVTETVSLLAKFATKRKIVLDMDEHRGLLCPLLQHGFVPMDDALPLLKSGHTGFLSDASFWQRPKSDDNNRSEEEITGGEIVTGCVLLGVVGGPAALNGDSTWWFSATINSKKIEISVDGSVKNFALLAFYPSVAVQSTGGSAEEVEVEDEEEQ